MKTLYSSSFLSVILAFFIFMGAKDYPIVTPGNVEGYSFSNIVEPEPKLFSETSLPESVTIEIFETFGCKDCMNFSLGTYKELKEKYKDDPRVEIKRFTIPDLSNEGEVAATIGVECAEEQGKGWEMYEALHITTQPLSQREVDLIGQELGLPVIAFRACLKSDKYGAKIGEDIAYAEEKGITRKPTILIGDYILYGNQPIENIERVIERIFNPSF